MKDVVLKGHQDGYLLTLKSTGSFEQILTELTDLFAQLNHDQQVAKKDVVQFRIETGHRLLTKRQREQVLHLIEQYPAFHVLDLSADVILKTEAQQEKEQNSVHINRAIIRSGQEVTVEGDVLFVGQIHHGGLLKATGHIFLLGDVAGIVQAGFPDNEEAVIVGDLSTAFQVRIADQVAIMADDQHTFTARSVAYINDLHLLDYGTLADLKMIRPKLYNKIGEA